MADGASALVDLDNFSLAHSAGDNISPADTLGALYAAMGSEAMAKTDPDTSNPDSPQAALGDAYAVVEEQRAAQRSSAASQLFSDNADVEEDVHGPNADMLGDLADAAQAQLLAMDDAGALTINPENLIRALAPEGEEPISRREAARVAMSNWRETVRAVIAQAQAVGDDAQLRAAQALLCSFDPATGRMSSLPTETTEAEYAQASAELGCPIPELKIDYDETGASQGDFEVGAAEKERIDLIRNSLSCGDRSFAFRGPPGSGKGEMASQLAAIMRAGFVPINVGPSNDLEQNIGGDGLRSKVVETEEALIGSDGEPLLDDKGKTRTITRQSVTMVSEMLLGPLAEAASRACVIEIQEPEGMEQEAIRLHSLLGEKVGEPAKRYLNINSSAAGKKISIPVHKDCIIIFTYNPGLEDVKLKQATHDRCVNLDFDYPTKEAESRRLARMVNRVLRDETNQVPPGLRREVEPKVLEPFVAIVEKMRNTARTNAAFIESPGSRTAARMCLQLMLQAYLGDNRSDRTVRLLLDYCRSYEEKSSEQGAPDQMVQSILGDELQSLQALSDAWFAEGAPARGDKPAAEVKKPTAARKPTVPKA
jgi:MoxR-like ATPase